MNIVCAKILGGYTMTRNHCPKCTMSLLKEPGLTALGVGWPVGRWAQLSTVHLFLLLRADGLVGW